MVVTILAFCSHTFRKCPPGELETSSTGAFVFVSMRNISKLGVVSDNNVSVLQL